MLKPLHWECNCASIYLFNYGYELKRYSNGSFDIQNTKYGVLSRSVREKCYEL